MLLASLDRLVLGLEPEQRSHWAERLFALTRIAGLHSGQHGWRDEMTAERMRAAADRGDRAMRARIVDVTEHLLHRGIVDQRPDRHLLVESVADDKARHLLRQPRGKLVVDLVLHEDAVRRHARLPGVAELAGHHALHRLSISASSKMMNGALPPSSRLSRFNVPADFSIR